MCLYTLGLNNAFKDLVCTSSEDIIVYKMFILKNTERVVTLYRRMEIDKYGDIMTTDSFGYKLYYKSWKVDKGIHAFVKYNFDRDKTLKFYRGVTDPKSFKSKDLFHVPITEIMCECIIPAYTPYVLGTGDEIVTLQLIVPPFNI